MVFERPEDIKEEVATFFENLYKGQLWRVSLSLPYQRSSIGGSNETLREEEVERALVECSSDKL